MSNIVLITDFGLSEYVGQIKGTIYKINPQVNIIDLTHNISKFNIIEAGYILFNSIEYFDEQSIFLTIVDPGVGTNRLPIIIQTKQNIYIGPNNGLFTLIIDKLDIIRIVKILNPFYLNKIISNTFHGRNIFAPISAHISKGIRITDLGSEINISEIIRLEGFYPSIAEIRLMAL